MANNPFEQPEIPGEPAPAERPTVPERPKDLKERREGRRAGQEGGGFYKFEERETEEERQKEILRLELRIAELQEELDELGTAEESSKRRERVKEEIAKLQGKIDELKRKV